MPADRKAPINIVYKTKDFQRKYGNYFKSSQHNVPNGVSFLLSTEARHVTLASAELI